MRAKGMLTGACVAGVVFFSGAAGLWTQSAQRSTGIAEPQTAAQVGACGQQDQPGEQSKPCDRK
jgi:hypothetical protein